MEDEITVRVFNSTAIDLLEDLAKILPRFKELRLGVHMARTLFHASPDNRLLVDKFWECTREYEKEIASRDTEALVRALTSVVPRPKLAKKIWKGLSQENQDVVMAYVELLFQQAKELACRLPPPGNESSDDTADPSSSAGKLYFLYNNMWKEFLHNISENRSSDLHAGELGACCSKVASLLETKGIQSPMLHGILASTLERLVEAEGTIDFRNRDILERLLPPSDLPGMIERDRRMLGNERMVLCKGMDWDTFLSEIQDGKDADNLSTYWHVIKIMSFTLSHCPPELLGIMGSLMDSFIGAMSD